jgi:hypothetical protein
MLVAGAGTGGTITGILNILFVVLGGFVFSFGRSLLSEGVWASLRPYALKSIRHCAQD